MNEESSKQMTPLYDQLKKLVEKAEEVSDIAKTYRDALDSLQLRLRPSVGSMSLVSCADDTPQLGFANIRDVDHLQKTLDELKAGNKKINPPIRLTPEKRLQSWLIREAMQEGGQVNSVGRALGDRHRYWFVSDELAFKQDPHSFSDQRRADKFVADLLLVREDHAGETEFVAVELKYKRDKGTHIQVGTFQRLLKDETLFPLWCGFARSMLGGNERRWKGPDSCQGLVIWPAGEPSRTTAELISKQRKEHIETLGYAGPPYSLRLE